MIFDKLTSKTWFVQPSDGLAPFEAAAEVAGAIKIETDLGAPPPRVVAMPKDKVHLNTFEILEEMGIPVKWVEPK